MTYTLYLDKNTMLSRSFRIYTRTGDSGTSSLYTGQRLPKDCSFFEALGDVDELNSAVGMAREYVLGASESLAAQVRPAKENAFTALMHVNALVPAHCAKCATHYVSWHYIFLQARRLHQALSDESEVMGKQDEKDSISSRRMHNTRNARNLN